VTRLRFRGFCEASSAVTMSPILVNLPFGGSSTFFLLYGSVALKSSFKRAFLASNKAIFILL